MIEGTAVKQTIYYIVLFHFCSQNDCCWMVDDNRLLTVVEPCRLPLLAMCIWLMSFQLFSACSSRRGYKTRHMINQPLACSICLNIDALYAQQMSSLGPYVKCFILYQTTGQIPFNVLVKQTPLLKQRQYARLFDCRQHGQVCHDWSRE